LEIFITKSNTKGEGFPSPFIEAAHPYSLLNHDTRETTSFQTWPDRQFIRDGKHLTSHLYTLSNDLEL